MRSHTLFIVLLVSVGLLASCSDNGSSPTGPGSGGGGGGTGQLSVSDVTVAEGAAAGFNVTLAAAVGSVVRFTWTVTLRSASAGDLSGTLTGTDSVAAGATNKVISVQTVNDTALEASEVFVFTLSSPVNATISNGTALGIVSASDGGVDVSWSGSVGPTLSSACGSCHPSNGGGFSVASPTTLRTTGSNAPDVIPGDGAGSNIIDKLSSASPSIGGARMPLGGPYLSAGTITTIRQWIDQGAQNN
ncbi:MAG: hypothetical protein HY851_10225 [candidate division Zixibacteria bacterium]|nr:hypothetical protein [candidate division Zixibacteria bacterium]